MKKIALFGALVLGLSFASCDGYEEPNPAPQTNPDQPVMETEDIAVASPEATATAVNFADYLGEEKDGLIPVLEFTRLENWPEQYELVGVMQYATTEAFADAKNVNLVYNADEKTLYAPVEDWETAHIELFTKNPQAVQGYVQFVLYARNGKSEIRLGDVPNTVFDRHALTVTPLPAERPVESEYFMIVNGTEVAMTPTNPANVYDPATFSAVVVVEEGQSVTVSFRSLSGIKYGQGSTTLDALAVDGAPIVISEQGPQLVTIDLENLTYKYGLAIEALYAYSSSANQGYALTTNDFVSYAGFAGLTSPAFMLANEKKLSPSMKWGAATEGDEVIPGMLELGSTTKIPVDDKGCYYIKVNLSGLTYSAVHCVFELIGGWDESWGDPIIMTPDSKYVKWTADLTIAEGTQFKVRTNGDWSDPNPNLGGGEWNAATGAYEGLVEHGDNLVWQLETGTYTVTLDVSKVPYTLTAVKK